MLDGSGAKAMTIAPEPEIDPLASTLSSAYRHRQPR
jgi:hypothetical protein